MTDPTKEEQLKAAVAQLRALMVPNVIAFTTDITARETLIAQAHKLLLYSIEITLNELWELEKNGH